MTCECRLRSELKQLEQHRARLSDKLSKQSIFEEFLVQVMSSSSEFLDIRSIMSRYHTLKQLYEVHSTHTAHRTLHSLVYSSEISHLHAGKSLVLNISYTTISGTVGR